MDATRRLLVLLSLVVLGTGLGCEDEDEADAHGTFEAETVTVSAEVEGQLVAFDVEEGQRLGASQTSEDQPPQVPRGEERAEARTVVGRIDTTGLALRRRELRARRQSVRSQIQTVTAEVEVLSEKLRAARRELERVRTLREGDAAPEREVDRAQDEVRVLERREAATRSQTASLLNEAEAITEQIAQVNERIRQHWIVNPIAGTVLTTYTEQGEVVRPGTPLYSVAPLDTLALRAFVSGAQLSGLQIGQEVRVFIDDGPDQQQERPGVLTWIASEAEFTPTPIQTREERVDFVYATKIRVPNPDGALKIGMPADVSFEMEANPSQGER